MPNTPVNRVGGPGGAPDGAGAGPPAGPGADTWLTVLTFVMLVLFGVIQGLLGSFFYGVGPAPVAALLFDLAILVTCVLGSWGLRRASGGLAPAAGWLVVVFVLASGTPGGSVVITASAAGEWFLFGGAASATAGVIAAFTLWSRAGLARSRGGRAG